MTTVQGTAVKPIKLQGNDYVIVADRVHAVLEAEEIKLNYSIIDEKYFELDGRHFITVTIKIYTDTMESRTFMGTSEIKFHNAAPKSADEKSPIECAETSAIGRALGFAGFGLIDSIATDDEIARARNTVPATQQSAPQQQGQSWATKTELYHPQKQTQPPRDPTPFFRST